MLTIENTGLLVVDIQGKLAEIIENSDELLNKTANLIQGIQTLGLPILALEQLPNKLGSTHPLIAKHLSNTPFMTKSTFDACLAPEFHEALKQKNVKNWLVCGIETHICVYQTCKSLLSNNFSVHLVADCTASRHFDNKQLALQQLNHAGAYLTNLEMCLFELLKDANHPQFKAILALVK